MKTSVLLCWRIVAASLPLIGANLLLAAAPATGPLRVHPDNPRWFQWRGHATALITSAEHYGAVLNLDFDSLFYEIQNEPWADNHTMGDFINPYLTEQHKWPNAVEVTAQESVAWQRAIARIIAAEEKSLPHQHLVAQNVANFRLAIRGNDLVPEASIVNFHYAYPEAVDWNRGLHRVIGYDETGFAGRDDATYRRQPWNFVLSGGGLFNSLDYSFSVGREDGNDTANQAPGGGGPALRRQLGVLSEFLHSYDLAKLYPDPLLVEHAPGVVTHTLSASGKACAVYLQGCSPTTLTLNLRRGRWKAEWIAVEDGKLLKRETISASGKPVDLVSPNFPDAVALRLVRR